MSANYLETIEAHQELRSLKEELVQRVEKVNHILDSLIPGNTQVMEKANAKKDSYLDYSYLWTDSRCPYPHKLFIYQAREFSLVPAGFLTLQFEQKT